MIKPDELTVGMKVEINTPDKRWFPAIVTYIRYFPRMQDPDIQVQYTEFNGRVSTAYRTLAGLRWPQKMKENRHVGSRQTDC